MQGEFSKFGFVFWGFLFFVPISQGTPNSSNCSYALRNLLSNTNSKWPIAFQNEKQKKPKSCSLATVTMIINSLTGQKFSQAEILEKSNFSHFWEKAISPSGDGIILEKMGLILADLLSSLNLNHYSVEVIHMNPQFKGSKERAMKALASVSRDNGRSQVLLGNFLQSRLVGDSDTASGHYSPVGGFDLATQSVYLSEPDGGSLRPAWNSITDFFLATETFDESSGNYRGFIWIYPK